MILLMKSLLLFLNAGLLFDKKSSDGTGIFCSKALYGSEKKGGRKAFKELKNVIEKKDV